MYVMWGWVGYGGQKSTSGISTHMRSTLFFLKQGLSLTWICLSASPTHCTVITSACHLTWLFMQVLGLRLSYCALYLLGTLSSPLCQLVEISQNQIIAGVMTNTCNSCTQGAEQEDCLKFEANLSYRLDTISNKN